MNDFDSLVRQFQAITPRKKVVVVCPDDEPTLGVIHRCLRDHLVQLELVARADRADAARAIAQAHPEDVTLTVTADAAEAAINAVKMVHDHRADVILKGNINTDVLLHPVLNKEYGLLPKGKVLSHVALAQVPGYGRLIMFSDAAVIPELNLEQLDAVIRYDVELWKRLGNDHPAVALIHFTEKFNPKFVITTYYKELLDRASRHEYGEGVVMGGPMDVKSACDAHAAAIKGIESPVVGKADILVFPTLVAANTFYKTLALFAHADLAAMLTGTMVPIVVPSRADSDESKFYSLALACVAAR